MLILEKQTCVLLVDAVTVLCVPCDFAIPQWNEWEQLECIHTHLWMPTLKNEEVIKWLHCLSHPHECHQEKTCGCPSRGFGRQTFAPWPIPFSWDMIKKQHNNRSTIFRDCGVTSTKFFEHWVNQPNNPNKEYKQFCIHLCWQSFWLRDIMTLTESCIFIYVVEKVGVLVPVDQQLSYNKLKHSM